MYPPAPRDPFSRTYRLSERIYYAVESEIREGLLQPGGRIDEEALMTRFSASRTPVREALLRLEARALIASQPRSGWIVAKLNVSQLFAVWELLADLESICARAACKRMSPDECQALAEAHSATTVLSEHDDRLGWRAANMAFHELLYQGARNQFLRQQILHLRTLTQAYRQHAFDAVGTVDLSHRGHGEIVEAILCRNPDAAAKAAFDHLNPRECIRSVNDFVACLPVALLA